MRAYLLLIIGYLLVNNYVMNQFLGICPFLGVSKKLDAAVGMGAAVTFVMGVASLMTWLVEHFILTPLDLMYMDTIAFILVIAVLVQCVEMVLKKISPSLYQSLGVYLPLITTNCAVLGIALTNSDNARNLPMSVVAGVAAALGFSMSLILFAAIRERLELSRKPKFMQGTTGSLIAAGLMAVAFMGFAGMPTA